MSVHEFPSVPGTARIEIPVTDTLARLVTACAARRGMTVADFVRRAIENEIAADQLLADRAAENPSAPGNALERYGYKGIRPGFFGRERP